MLGYVPFRSKPAAMVRVERSQGGATINRSWRPCFLPQHVVGRAMLAIEMPLYDYRCTTCGRAVEELQKFTDPPPVSEDLCPGPPTPQDEDAEIEQEITRRQTRVTCVFERVPTTALQRWPGDHNNDGRGGWVRQKDGVTMVRVQQGRNTTKYGEGSV